MEILLTHELTASRMAQPAVEALARANTFDDARRRFARVLKIPTSAWTPDLVDRIERIPEENDQIAGANYGRLPEEIRNLVERLRTAPATSETLGA